MHQILPYTGAMSAADKSTTLARFSDDADALNVLSGTSAITMVREFSQHPHPNNPTAVVVAIGSNATVVCPPMALAQGVDEPNVSASVYATVLATDLDQRQANGRGGRGPLHRGGAVLTHCNVHVFFSEADMVRSAALAYGNGTGDHVDLAHEVHIRLRLIYEPSSDVCRQRASDWLEEYDEMPESWDCPAQILCCDVCDTRLAGNFVWCVADNRTRHALAWNIVTVAGELAHVGTHARGAEQ